MAAAVTREKEESVSGELPADDRVARRAIRGVDADLFDVREGVELVEAAAAEDGQRMCAHCRSS